MVCLISYNGQTFVMVHFFFSCSKGWASFLWFEYQPNTTCIHSYTQFVCVKIFTFYFGKFEFIRCTLHEAMHSHTWQEITIKERNGTSLCIPVCPCVSQCVPMYPCVSPCIPVYPHITLCGAEKQSATPSAPTKAELKAVADKLLEAFTAPGTDERQLHQQSVKWLMDLKTDLHPYPI